MTVTARLHALRWPAAAMLFALAMLPVRAAGHAPPQIFEVSFGGDDRVVLLTNRGLIFGDLSSGQWRLMCNEALRINSSERPALALLPDGSLLAATSVGMQITRDGGCSWEPDAQLGAMSAPALTQDAADRSTLYAGVFGAGASGIYVTRDAGAEWAELLAVADNDFIEELLLASATPTRLYASGLVFDAEGEFTHYVLRSSDGGTSFERSEVELLTDEDDLTLLAVSPTDPESLLARALGTSASTSLRMDRLLISRDAGRTWSGVLSVNTLLDADFGADGDTIFVAGNEGLWRSTDAAATFQTIDGAAWMSCAFQHEGSLWACGHYVDGEDGIGVSADGGESFTRLMAFTEVTAQVSCEAQSATGTACATLWRDWEREILGPLDAGSPAQGGAGGPPSVDGGRPVPARSKGGCAASSGTGGAWQAAFALALAALGLRARTRRGKVRTAHDGRLTGEIAARAHAHRP